MFQGFDEEVTLHNLSFLDVIRKTIEVHKDITFKNGIIVEISDSHTEKKRDFGVDCTGLWAIPSLIDAHAHLSFNPFMSSDVSNSFAIILNLTDAALSGVCLVRDLGANKKMCVKIADVQNQSDIYFPEVIPAGTPVCIDSGHGFDFGTCVPYDEIDHWIGAHKAEGYEWIKIMNDPENHAQEYLNYFVAKAHQAGLLVACHAFTKDGIESAIIAQVDTIEHSVPYDISTFEKARNIYFVPTAYSAWISTRMAFLKTVAFEEAGHLLRWNELLENHFGKAIAESFRFITGTDGGSSPSMLHDITREIKIFSHYGMDLMQCLAAATIIPAECLRRENMYGSIEVGKYANIVLLETNPLERIDALDKKRAIFLRGVSILNEVMSPWN